MTAYFAGAYVDARNCMLVALERAQSRKKDQDLFVHVGDKRLALFDADAYVAPWQWTHLVKVTVAGEVIAP